MAYTILVVGKGGVGKTTVSALLVRLLSENYQGSILAVDADPNSNLAEFLGLEIKETIGTVLSQINEEKDKIPAGISKDRFIEYKVQTIIDEQDKFDILTMGRPEGPGCYCYVNNVLRNVLEKLMKKYDFVIIDNEAGMEHLSRKTMAVCDVFLVVAESTPAGLRAAQRIAEIAKELKIKAQHKFILLNRVKEEEVSKKLKGIDLQLLGILPEDEQIAKFSQEGQSLFRLDKNSKVFIELKKIIKKIIGG
ncbi:MAG: AAA family ATPase [Candidatus Omnitrophica bacterium]|nr:AAA family ATPase [Candidatus Omnitrophota bacterium]